MRKAYLAGPEVFLPNAVEIGERKKEICASHGFEGLFPLDKEIAARGQLPADIAQAIYSANRDLLEKAELIIANMTPFRGPAMDVGTAFEMGFAHALAIPVFGYANVEARLVDRVLRAAGLKDVSLKYRGAPVDALGMEIEPFGFFENLMVEIPVRMTAGEVVTGVVPSDRLFTDLSVFERCVRRAAKVIGMHSSESRHRRIG